MMSIHSSYLYKKAFLIQGGIGAVRAANLSDDEKNALRKHYGLSDDPNLMLRNAGRGVVGGLLGGGLGAAGGALLASRLRSMNPLLIPQLTIGGALAGTLLGAAKATDKYSKGNVNRIINNSAQDTMARRMHKVRLNNYLYGGSGY